MESKAVVLHADREPIRGITDPGPHQIYKNPKISIEKRTLGDLSPSMIRVEILYAGVCGTDVHLLEKDPGTGYIRSTAPTEIPTQGRIIGHEGIGRILEVGSGVQYLRPNAYVTFESIIVCYTCDVCRRGQFNQCCNAKLLGLEVDGLFGTVVDIPSSLAHDVTKLIKKEQDLRALACTEPAGVAYVACRNGNVQSGDVVVVFGAGPIGLFSAMLSKTIFGATVHMIEPIPFRRELAKTWSDEVYDVEEFFRTASPPIDVVIEASGSLDNITRMFRRVNANGRIVLLARSGVALTLNAIDHMITNAISISGSRGHLGGAFHRILNLYDKGRIPLDEIVTLIVDGPEGLCDLLKSPEKIIAEHSKVLVRMR